MASPQCLELQTNELLNKAGRERWLLETQEQSTELGKTEEQTERIELSRELTVD